MLQGARGNRLWLLPVFVIGCIYYNDIIRSIQIGDSAEFLLAASQNSVPHPPGFPFYVLLLRTINVLLPSAHWISGVGVFTASLSLLTIGVISYTFRRNLLSALLIPATLGFSFVFWRFSLLPDVFAFHLCLSALYLSLALQNNRKKNLLLSTLFGFGCAHHPSFIFLLPFQFRTLINESRKKICQSIATSILAFALSYSSIFLLDRTSFWSWGELNGLLPIIAHFLRFDFGTFQLSTAAGGSHYFQIVSLFTKELILDFSPLLILLGLGIYRLGWVTWQSNKTIIFTLLAYLACFFPLMNILPAGYGQEVVERFFLLPELLLCFLVGRIWSTVKIKPKDSLLFFLLVMPAWSFLQYQRENSFYNNGIVSEFAQNILEQVRMDQENKAAAILVTADTSYFALNFFIANQPRRYRNITIISPEMLFYSWYQKKITAAGLNLEKIANAPTTKELALDDLFRSNRTFRFYSERTRLSPEVFRIVVLPAAERIELGHGWEISAETFSPAILSFPKPNMRSGFDSYRALFSLYAYFDTESGFESLRRNDRKTAHKKFLAAIHKVPYALPAFEGLCIVSGSPQCRSTADKLRKGEYDYFRGVRW